MASYDVNAYGAQVKVRDPGIVVLFFFLTLGFLIYPQVWYYRINRELRDYGAVYKNEHLASTRPWLSVLAITLGGLLIVPPIVSYWRTTGRIRRAQEIAGQPLTNGWVIFALYIGSAIFVIPGLGIPAYVQSGLNGIWERYRGVDTSAAGALDAAPQAEGTVVPGSEEAAPPAAGSSES